MFWHCRHTFGLVSLFNFFFVSPKKKQYKTIKKNIKIAIEILFIV